MSSSHSSQSLKHQGLVLTSVSNCSGYTDSRTSASSPRPLPAAYYLTFIMCPPVCQPCCVPPVCQLDSATKSPSSEGAIRYFRSVVFTSSSSSLLRKNALSLDHPYHALQILLQALGVLAGHVPPPALLSAARHAVVAAVEQRRQREVLRLGGGSRFAHLVFIFLFPSLCE